MRTIVWPHLWFLLSCNNNLSRLLLEMFLFHLEWLDLRSRLLGSHVLGSHGGCSVMELLHAAGLLVVALNLLIGSDLTVPAMARELFHAAGLLKAALNLVLALAPLLLHLGFFHTSECRLLLEIFVHRLDWLDL